MMTHQKNNEHKFLVAALVVSTLPHLSRLSPLVILWISSLMNVFFFIIISVIQV